MTNQEDFEKRDPIAQETYVPPVYGDQPAEMPISAGEDKAAGSPPDYPNDTPYPPVGGVNPPSYSRAPSVPPQAAYPAQNPYGRMSSGGQSPYSPPGYTYTYTPSSFQNAHQPVSPQMPLSYPQQTPWPRGQYAAPPTPVPPGPYLPYTVPAAGDFMPPDLTKPLAVMARRRLRREEFDSLLTIHGGLKSAFFVIAAILAILFSLVAIFYAGETGDRVGLWLTVGLSALSGIALLLYPIWRHVYMRRQIDRIYACQQDAEEEIMVTELYADRIESIYSRGKSVVYYQRADVYETADLLVVAGDGASIVFRAEDMTPAQLQVLYGILLPRLRPGSRKNRGGFFFPRGVVPPPVPPVENRDQVRLSFVVGEEKEETGYGVRSAFGRMLPFFLPLFTVIAIYTANNIAFSPSLTVDIGLNMLMYWVLGILILLGATAIAVKKGQAKRKETDPAAAYAFTRDGMARRWAGGTVFVPWAYIKSICRKKGVRLMTPYGSFYIEWQDVPDPNLLRAILKGDVPTKPPEGDQTNG